MCVCVFVCVCLCVCACMQVIIKSLSNCTDDVFPAACMRLVDISHMLAAKRVDDHVVKSLTEFRQVCSLLWQRPPDLSCVRACDDVSGVLTPVRVTCDMPQWFGWTKLSPEQ